MANGIPGIKNTKFSKTMEYFTAGYSADIKEILAARKGSSKTEVAFVRIPFASMCAHHILPFFGEATIAYIPAGRILGAGRINLLVDALSRRLQMQETLTQDIAKAMEKHLRPAGVAVMLDATQLCTLVSSGKTTRMQTTAFCGRYAKSDALKKRFAANIIGGAGE